MTEFQQFDLSPALLKATAELGFVSPTPVQEAVIPILLEGRRDMVALAQTGTGKTAAFGIPLLQRVNTSDIKVKTVVLCPTRELCLQVCRDIKSYAKYIRGLRTVAIYGGAPIQTQLKALGNGVHIIVATPGRLHDIVRRGKVDLSTATCVVLDEADEMLSMGFEEDLSAIMAGIPDTVQKLLFSATMPRQVERLASKHMNDPVEITIGNRNAGAENVSHECYMVNERDRYIALKRIVDVYPDCYALIFCRTRVETQEIAARLMQDGYNADSLHGDLSQAQRDRVMGAFRSRTLKMLVATDVAARGLDINDLTHVINYQLPDELEAYIHRSGRTGRAGKTGQSVVLINPREGLKIQRIEKSIGKQFVFKHVPSGQDVCEAQLYRLISRTKEVEVDEKQIEPYLPKVMELLDDLTKEDLIKQFVSLELKLTLDYYRNVPDISFTNPTPQGHPSRERVTLCANLGNMDGFSPALLMDILNSNSGKNVIPIGKIDVKDAESIFDVSPNDVARIMEILNGQRVNGNKLRVKIIKRAPVMASAHKKRRSGPPKAGRGVQPSRPKERSGYPSGQPRRAKKVYSR